jgi:hypothetical protein
MSCSPSSVPWLIVWHPAPVYTCWVSRPSFQRLARCLAPVCWPVLSRTLMVCVRLCCIAEIFWCHRCRHRENPVPSCCWVDGRGRGSWSHRRVVHACRGGNVQGSCSVRFHATFRIAGVIPVFAFRCSEPDIYKRFCDSVAPSISGDYTNGNNDVPPRPFPPRVSSTLFCMQTSRRQLHVC